MEEVLIVEAVRSPIGRRKGGLSGLHPAELLGVVQKAAVERSGVDPAAIGQIVAGCVSQVGEQSFNIARTAWLAQGLPQEVPATTVDSQCGSSQQATTLAAGLVGAGIEDLVLACGVEMMTRVPLGSNSQGGRPLPKIYRNHYEFASQFQGAEMIAKEYGITREDTDLFGLRSQQHAQAAWREGRYTREVVPVDAPVLGEDGKPPGSTAFSAASFSSDVSRRPSSRDTVRRSPVGFPSSPSTGASTGTTSRVYRPSCQAACAFRWLRSPKRSVSSRVMPYSFAIISAPWNCDANS